MRKFTLYFDGVAYPLNGGTAMLTNPTGLGFNLSPSVADLKSGFFKTVDKNTIPQKPIVCNITFFRTVSADAYANYQNFTSKVFAAQSIELGYTPYGTGEYRCAVCFDYLQKTEKRGNTLTCPMALLPLTPWYINVPIELELRASQDDVQLYTATFDVVTGDIPAAFEITAASSGTPFQVSFVEMPSYNILGALAFPLSAEGLITAAGRFSYSSKYGDSHATHTSSGGVVTDLVDRIVIENEIFPRLPVGKTVMVMIAYATGTAKPSKIDMKLYSYFRSV